MNAGRRTRVLMACAAIAMLSGGCSERADDDASTSIAAPAGATPGVPANASANDAAKAPAVVPDAPAPRYVFGFTSVSEAEDPRIVDWVEDPCGVTAMASVNRLPIDDPSLLPDFVVEFDTGGAEVRRWAKPYSAEIVAIAGERLHFRADHDGRARVFWTQPDGAFGVLDERLAVPVAAPARGFADGATTIDCPALPVFEGSDYVQCFEIADGAGARRRVAFEGACS